MPELGPMMRALELQRLIEDKVSEWRERSSRVVGASVADSYHQPANFRRHTNRRKNSAEINRIIAKYSKPNKKADDRHFTHQTTVKQTIYEQPVRPARNKKNSLKGSKSEDNLANIMETNPAPEIKAPPRFKYRTKSYEDITEFIDIDRSKKSQNFEENSILNAKTAKTSRPKLHSICEDTLDMTQLKDSGIEIRSQSNFKTSTPISKRKTYSEGESVTLSGFQKCAQYAGNMFTLKKLSRSEPDILSASTSVESVDSNKTSEGKKRWRKLKSPFRKAAFSLLVPWRKKQQGRCDSR